jgi:hypothetical protein
MRYTTIETRSALSNLAVSRARALCIDTNAIMTQYMRRILLSAAVHSSPTADATLDGLPGVFSCCTSFQRARPTLEAQVGALSTCQLAGGSDVSCHCETLSVRPAASSAAGSHCGGWASRQ